MNNEAVNPDLPSLRYARLYDDGSLSVERGGYDLETATRHLNASSDDDDTEMVQVHTRVVRTFGKPKLKIVKQHCVTCPTCSEEIWFDETAADGGIG